MDGSLFTIRKKIKGQTIKRKKKQKCFLRLAKLALAFFLFVSALSVLDGAFLSGGRMEAIAWKHCFFNSSPRQVNTSIIIRHFLTFRY